MDHSTSSSSIPGYNSFLTSRTAVPQDTSYTNYTQYPNYNSLNRQPIVNGSGGNGVETDLYSINHSGSTNSNSGNFIPIPTIQDHTTSADTEQNWK